MMFIFRSVMKFPRSKKEQHFVSFSTGPRTWVSLLVIIALLSTTISCGGRGGGGGSTVANEPPANTVETVQGNARIELPSGMLLSPETLTITAGVGDQQQVKTDGSAAIKLNKDTPQVVSATNSSGRVVLMDIGIPTSGANGRAQEGTQLTLNANTTATSLIMLNFYIASIAMSSPAMATQIKQTISSLPETMTLSRLIGTKLAADTDILSKNDSAITDALSAATKAAILKVNSMVTVARKQGKLEITPDAEQSGVTISATEKDSSGNSTLTISSGKKRFVAAYVDAPDEVARLVLPSKTNFWDSPIKRSLTLNVAKYPTALIKVYGPGWNKFNSVKNDPKGLERTIPPLVATAINDWGLPTLRLITGVKTLFSGDPLGSADTPVKKLLTKLLGKSDVIKKITDQVANGLVKEAMTTLAIAAIQIMCTNEDGILLEALTEIGWWGTLALLANLASYLVPILGEVWVAAKVVMGAGEVVAAVADFFTSSWREVFFIAEIVPPPVDDNKPPTAIIGADKTEGATPLTVNFTGYGFDPENGSVAFFWNFGDGTTSLEHHPSHTYASSGLYVVTLTVTDDHNKTGKDLKIITAKESVPANRPPTPTAYANQFSGTVPFTVNFTGKGIDPEGGSLSYAWDFGDGSYANTQNPSHTYATAGNYIVFLTIIDNSGLMGEDSIAITVTAKVNQPPSADIGASPTSGPAPLSVNFTGAGNDPEGGSIAFSWNFGDGSAPSTEHNPTHTYSSLGNYVVTLTVTDDTGRIGVKAGTITVLQNQPPTASAAANPNSGVVPLAVTFIGTGSDPEGGSLSYNWDFGDGSAASSAQNPSHIYNNAGIYAVTLTVTDNAGKSTRASTGVTAQPSQPQNQPPTASAVVNPTSGFAPLTVNFTGTGTDPEGGPLSYAWNFGDGSPVASGQNASHTYVIPGIYTATLTVTDSGGKMATISLPLITVPQNPLIFQENFDSYASGSFPSSGGWGLIYNGYGTAYQVVDSAASVSASNSFRLEGAQNWSAAARRRISTDASVVAFEFYLRVDSVAGASDQQGTVWLCNYDNPWNGRYYGHIDLSTGKMRTGAYEFGAYQTGRWYKMKFITRRGTGKFDLYVDDLLTGSGLPCSVDGWFDGVVLQSGNPAHTVTRFDNLRMYVP